MRTDRFEDLCAKMNQIIALVDKVPSDMRSEVFKTLFEAAKDSQGQNLYAEEIIKLSTDKKPIQEYIAEKKPVSNIERSLLFVYYLENLGVEAISAKHISACYEICNLNEPGNLTQNLRDACSARYGYLESVQNYFRTTEKGKEFCTS